MGHWPNGSTAAWRRTRARVLERDGNVCQLQIPEVCVGTATHVHHTQERDEVGDDPRFLVAACAPCNIRVGDPTVADPDPLPDW